MEETDSLENPIPSGKCYLDLNRACNEAEMFRQLVSDHGLKPKQSKKPTPVSPFDVAQVLVDRHYLEYAQTQLAGRDHIFTFDPLFAPQACRVLEVPEAPLMDLPGIAYVWGNPT